MIEKISLKDFALTGEFGPVKVGMSKEEVIGLLGRPDYYEDLWTGFTAVLYSWYEFFFDTESGILDSIQNDHLQSDCLNHEDMILFKNEKFEVDIWFLKLHKDISRREVKELLTSEGISFKEEERYDTIIYRFESGVYLDFSEGDDPVLNGIRFFPYRA